MADKNVVTFIRLKETLENLWGIAKNTFAHLYEDNIFHGKNSFVDLHIGGENTNLGSITITNTGCVQEPTLIKYGNRGIDSHASNPVGVEDKSGFVHKLRIAAFGKNPGQKTRVKVWEVKKGETKADDVATVLYENLELTVYEGDGTITRWDDAVNYVDVIINKTYTEPTYFIFQCLEGNVLNVKTVATPSEDHIYLEESQGVETEIQNASSNKECLFKLYYSAVSIDDYIKSKIKDEPVEWIDLEHVTEEISFENLYTTKMTYRGTGDFSGDGSIGSNQNWMRVVFPVEHGKTYKLTNKRAISNNTAGTITGSSHVVEFNENLNKGIFDQTTFVRRGTWSGSGQVHGRNVISYTVQDNNATHIGFNINKAVGWENSSQEIMIWESSQNPSSAYVEEKEVAKIVIDGDKVTIKYESLNNNIQARELKAILEELAGKIASGGTVTSVNGVIPTGDTKNIELQATSTFADDKLKLTTNGGTNVVFTEVDCYTQTETTELLKLLV